MGFTKKETYTRYNHSPPGIWATYKMGAKRRNISMKLSFDDFILLINQDCHYCDAPPKQYNGIDRKSSKRGYTKLNCVPCCTTCNYAKNTLSYKVFKKYTIRLAIAQLKKLID